MSSLRAKAALQHLARYSPVGLFGNLPGCSSADVWMQIQLAIERGHLDNRPLFGLSADLTKAFNMVPRVPVIALSRLCGLPENLCRPWLSAITGLRRRFKVRGSVGPAVLSNCGFPEGDPLSCVAMTVANIAFHATMAGTASPNTTLSFVDNYEALSPSFEGILEAREALQKFSKAWDMPVDDNKTVFWCTHAQGRAALRASGLSVALDFRDLGAHLQTSLRYSNFTQTQRVKALRDRWPRLEASQAPFAQKVRALAVAAWPAALHGVCAVPMGDYHFTTMRSAALKGINLKAPGANPMLQLSLLEHPSADPYFFALRASFWDVKCLAGQAAVAPLLSSAAARTDHCPGPAHVLLARANSVGIAWSPDAETFRDSFGQFNLWSVSCAEVQFRLAWAWQDTVAQRISSRATFAGLEAADPRLTRPLFNSFSFEEKAVLRLALNGTFYTNDALCHFGANDSKNCAFCGAEDSIAHRVCHCPYFAQCRAEAGVSEQELSTAPPAQVQHGWAMRPTQLQDMYTMLANLEVSFTDFHAWPEGSDFDLFTDGSCLRPTDSCLRLATWAVNIATLEWPPRPCPLSAGLVPGLLQSPFRGELCAVVSAVLFCWRSGSRVRVWCDCASAVKRVRKWLVGNWSPAPRTAHYDLWRLIQPCRELVSSKLSIHKVSAHADVDAELTFADEWCSAHNAFVDQAAARAQALRSADFWSIWQRCVEEYEAEWSRGRRILRLHALVALRAIKNKPQLQVLEVPVATITDATPASTIGILTADQFAKLASRYGHTYLERLMRWRGVTERAPSTRRWISSAQLFVAFCLTWVAPPPILRDGSFGSTPPCSLMVRTSPPLLRNVFVGSFRLCEQLPRLRQVVGPLRRYVRTPAH